MRIGWTELCVILVLAILLFGTQRISGLGKALGTSMREFKEELRAEEGKETKGHEGTSQA